MHLRGGRKNEQLGDDVCRMIKARKSPKTSKGKLAFWNAWQFDHQLSRKERSHRDHYFHEGTKIHRYRRTVNLGTFMSIASISWRSLSDCRDL